MIYHYMGAEVEIIALKSKQQLRVKTKEGGYESEHHVSEFKADNGVQEINNAIKALDPENRFWEI